MSPAKAQRRKALPRFAGLFFAPLRLCGRISFVADVFVQSQQVMGYALYQAQRALKAPSAKVLTGFGSAGVLEIVDDYQTDTYRAVYTVKFSDSVYVLHAFQKKSRKGNATPKAEIELVKKRLKVAEEDHKTRQLGRGRDR